MFLLLCSVRKQFSAQKDCKHLNLVEKLPPHIFLLLEALTSINDPSMQKVTSEIIR